MEVPDAPYVQSLDDERDKFAIQSYLDRMSEVARLVSFLDTSGGVANGRKAQNIDGVWLAYTSNGTANTADSVTHSLGRIPVDFLVGVPDKAASIYDGGVAWTATTISLKSDAATTVVNLFLF